ncbi:sorting nexin-21 isoform X2 [Nematostella vectensis]|uniref:sorting nexin-21 isoform X2 n=1 Tax=Nematostella vectensis TaxID=45351 RepID=UPI0020776153|nr:sorting nexin-21 isoform X2 [Nematostella vectensis]
MQCRDFSNEEDEMSATENGFHADSIIRGMSTRSLRDLKKTLRFEIISTRICEVSKQKHVSYAVAVMRTDRVDVDKAVVDRRYSDFVKLYKGLRKLFPRLMSKVQLPSKVIGSKNFNIEVLQLRSHAFETFLQYIYSQDEICTSEPFKEFFYMPDLKQACSDIRGGKFTDALSLLLNALHLQQKLNDGFQETVATLGSVVVVLNALENFKEAEKYATEALELIGHDMGSAYLIPLLSTCSELRWKLGMDKKKLEKRLIEVQRNCGIEMEHAFTLRELAVTRYTEIDQ